MYIHFPCQVLSYFLMKTLFYHNLWRILMKELCIWKLMSLFQLYELIRKSNSGFLFHITTHIFSEHLTRGNKSTVLFRLFALKTEINGIEYIEFLKH